MNTFVVSDIPGLFALHDDWNALADDIPFRTHEWLATWWMHYGAGHVRHRELNVVGVKTADNRLVGIAPWYVDRSLAKGRTIRWLGDGEVCTDHLTLLCAPEHRHEVASALAQHLTERPADWDLLELEGVDGEDQTAESFVDELRNRGCLVQRRAMESCWIIDLPKDWPAFLKMQSKSHRKQLDRLSRRTVDVGHCVWHRVETEAQFAQTWPMLVNFHQRRWESVGEPGVFASQAFHDYHEQVARQMLTLGYLRLSWLELDGTPIAAEHQFGNRHATYGYQGGYDPARAKDQPGLILKILSIRDAIATGQTEFDLLRGDEPYKAHWRATPHATYRLRVVPLRQNARVRAKAYDAARQVKRLLRTGSQWLWGAKPQVAGTG